MIPMKFMISILFLGLWLPHPAQAENGGRGGDPRVVEFLAEAKNFCSWLNRNPALKIYVEQCKNEVQDLSDSVNLDDRIPRISFVIEDVSDSTGTPKDVVTYPDRTLKGNIDRWDKENSLQ